MTHGSLFSGIGGFDLAAEWMGWENKFHCEWNPFGQKVLKYYWPEAESFDDITKTDFTKYANRIDILTGGFPCQPYSLAGKRKGKEDDRHLWPEMLRAISEIQPRWVIGENVFGLVNWSDGLVFHEVQSDLEAKGYEVWPYVLPASSVNAPHRRDRIWFIAHSTIKGREKWKQNGRWTNTKKNGNWVELQSERPRNNGDASNSNCTPSQCRNSKTTGKREKSGRRIESFCKHSGWQKFPTVPPICNGDDGLSDRLDGITFSKWRKESIKAGGNAIVPQVAFQIFKTIKQYETIH